MSKDARNEDLYLTSEAKVKLDELVPLLARQGFGPDGPPRETTFAQIEQFGHQAGRLASRAVDAHLAARHAAQFTEEEPCPFCDEKYPPKASPPELPLRTQDGEVTLHEPTYPCSSCQQERIALRIDGGFGADGVVCQRDQHSSERDGKVLERRRQRRIDPPTPGRRVVRQRPADHLSRQPSRQSLPHQRPSQHSPASNHRLKNKPVPALRGRESGRQFMWQKVARKMSSPAGNGRGAWRYERD